MKENIMICGLLNYCQIRFNLFSQIIKMSAANITPARYAILLVDISLMIKLLWRFYVLT